MSNNQTGPAEFYMYDVLGTHYPYYNVSQVLWNPYLTRVRKAVADFNPFAYRQVPNQARAAFGLRYGNSFYWADKYPNYVTFYKWFATHYDPLKDEQFSGKPTHWTQQKFAPPNLIPAVTSEKLPRPCTKQIMIYNRCEMINGAEKCKKEGQEILEICPNWALDAIKEKHRWINKATAIQNKQYRAAMEVSEYNKGRTPTDVSDKLWKDGTRFKLRPDTMWADERYAKITQSEINEAKQRVAARDAARKAHAGHHEHKHDHAHHDSPYIATIRENPLYP